MTSETNDPERQLADLKASLVTQGEQVREMIEDAVEAVFAKNAELAGRVIEADEGVDLRDVAIERKAVELLALMTRGAEVSEHDLRLLLTVVKVNNEYERVADLAVYIAERIESFMALSEDPPPKFRVLANSVIGIMSTTNSALEDLDTDAATLVLSSDDATEAFKNAVMHEIEQGLAEGKHTVDFAFALNRMAASLGRIADHCTNVAEQVIYVETSKIVRHRSDKWSAPTEPEA